MSVRRALRRRTGGRGRGGQGEDLSPRVGRGVSAKERVVIASVDPMTGEVAKEFAPHSPSDWSKILQASFVAQRAWALESHQARADALRALAHELRRSTEECAGLMAMEMGKPVREGRAEIEKCAWCCEYYADHGEGLLADEPVETDAQRSFVRHLALGPVLAIMPWNYPFWQVVRCLAPALAVGDSVVLKHASNVPQSALALEELVRRAGLPPDLLRVVLVEGSDVGSLIDDPRVAAVSLTGSEGAGRSVAARAGAALKKTVLELGGSDPFIVLADADIAATATAAAAARTVNSGQSCIAAKRFLVSSEVADPFVAALVASMQAIAVGDPRHEETQVGPQARHDLRDELHDQVVRSVASGAKLVSGGVVPDSAGAFYPPSVLTDVDGTPAATEEMFGPVAAVTTFSTEEELLAKANTCRYGLGASVWTADVARAEVLSRRLQSGMVFVNGAVKSDPRLPFGGVKASGFGRELGGRYGLLELANTQAVWERQQLPM